MALVTSLWLGYSIYYPLRKLPIVDAVLRAGRARRALEREHLSHCPVCLLPDIRLILAHGLTLWMKSDQR